MFPGLENRGADRTAPFPARIKPVCTHRMLIGIRHCRPAALAAPLAALGPCSTWNTPRPAGPRRDCGLAFRAPGARGSCARRSCLVAAPVTANRVIGPAATSKNLRLVAGPVGLSVCAVAGLAGGAWPLSRARTCSPTSPRVGSPGVESDPRRAAESGNEQLRNLRLGRPLHVGRRQKRRLQWPLGALPLPRVRCPDRPNQAVSRPPKGMRNDRMFIGFRISAISAPDRAVFHVEHAPARRQTGYFRPQ